MKNIKKAVAFLVTQGVAVFCWIVSISTLVGGVSAAMGQKNPQLSSELAAGVGLATGFLWVIAALTALVGSILWCIDVFTLSKQTDAANEKIEGEIIAAICASEVSAAQAAQAALKTSSQ